MVDTLANTNFLSQEPIIFTVEGLRDLTLQYLGPRIFEIYFPGGGVVERFLRKPDVREMLLLTRLGLNVDGDIYEHYRKIFIEKGLGDLPFYIHGAMRARLVEIYLGRALEFGYERREIDYMLRHVPDYVYYGQEMTAEYLDSIKVDHTPVGSIPDLDALFEHMCDFLKDNIFMQIDAPTHAVENLRYILLERGKHFPARSKYFSDYLASLINWRGDRSFFLVTDALDALFEAQINPFIIASYIQHFKSSGLLSSKDSAAYLGFIHEEY